MFHRADYLNVGEEPCLIPTTRLVYLGIARDSILCQFEVPEDKLVKLEAIIRVALETSMITFAMLEKLARKSTNMAVAVPAASLHVSLV